MIESKAWILDDKEDRDKPLTHRWTYNYRSNESRNVESVSARCIVRGDYMKPGIHYDAIQTSAQSPSHTIRRLLYAHVALDYEFMRVGDVPSAYPKAPADKRFRVTMTQPKRSSGTFTIPAKIILLNCAQMGSPDGGFLWEEFRTKKLKEL